MEIGVYVLPSVVVPMRVDTYLQGSHSGPTNTALAGVNAKLEAKRWSVSQKTVGQESCAKWFRV